MQSLIHDLRTEEYAPGDATVQKRMPPVMSWLPAEPEALASLRMCACWEFWVGCHFTRYIYESVFNHFLIKIFVGFTLCGAFFIYIPFIIITAVMESGC